MNRVPTLSPEIRGIFVRWSAAGKSVAASLKENTLRAKILESADTLSALGRHGGEDCEGQDVSAVLLDPSVTYGRVVFLADILAQLPEAAVFHLDLAEAATVRAWLRRQRVKHGDSELQGAVDAGPGAGFEMA